MSDDITPNAAQSIMALTEISAAANAEAKNKTAIWADKIETENLIILESLMENYETWNLNFRNELMKRDCLDSIKFHHNVDEKLSVV